MGPIQISLVPLALLERQEYNSLSFHLLHGKKASFFAFALVKGLNVFCITLHILHLLNQIFSQPAHP